MAETQFKYDVFISYNHADEKWVVGTLLPALEKAGLKVCIDFRDLTGGEIAILDIQNAVKASRQVIFVLTRNWKAGKWAQLEARLAGTLATTNAEYKIIPLVCEKGIEKEVDEFITMRNWIDFTGKDQSLAWKQLSDALGKPATFDLRPSTTNWFYGHRYGDLENFTGRAAEMQMLDEWLGNDKDNLLVFTAFGGFGKSALTWQWFNNRVDKTKWQTAIWWSFYEKESGFESFLAETLTHLGVEVKESARQQVNDLLEALRGTNILVVLDGFERLLRQYGRMDAALQSDDEDAEIDPSQRDCSSPLTETFLRGLSGAGMKSKVLMTTRLCPRALESADGKLLKGCRDESLSAFSPEDVVTYFHNEGIKATRAEILALCATYGYHPLSLSLLVGLINADHEKRGDIEAVKNLEIFADVKARRHHVMERAYGSLAPERRDLLSKISCFRGSMEYAVLKKVFPSPDLDKALLDLRKRGLLQYAGETQRYDMHPIVRHYAYEKFTVSKRVATHARLYYYFADLDVPKQAKTINDLTPIIELYHHTVRAGDYDQAANIFYSRLNDLLYYQFSAYGVIIELIRDLLIDQGQSKLRSETLHAVLIMALANAYCQNGQQQNSLQFFEQHNKISERNPDKRNLAVGLGNLAISAQLSIGDLRSARANLHRAVVIAHELDEGNLEALSRSSLGLLLFYLGLWNDASDELEIALQIFKKKNYLIGVSLVLSYKIHGELLMCREGTLREIHTHLIEEALKDAHLWEEKRLPVESHYVRLDWLIGASYRIENKLDLAEDYLHEALTRDRAINLVEMEANILLELARLRYAQGDFKDAQEKASEALVITERCGYVLQGADVHLMLATLALEGHRLKVEGGLSDKEAARKHAKEAMKLATCDGPPYYYKVAYEEAEAMLEKLSK